MNHLFICSLFSYRVADMHADIFILCRLAETQAEALMGLDLQNDSIHPHTEWDGHQTSASQAGDELILLAAKAIQDSLAMGNVVDPNSMAPVTSMGDIRALSPCISGTDPTAELPPPLPPIPTEANPIISGPTDGLSFFNFGDRRA